MTTKPFCIISILAAMLFVGCASNQPVVQAPSPQELEWANKVIALDQQQKELQKQEKEFKELKARADSEREEAKAKNWLAQNKEEIEKQFTSIYQTNGQSILDAYGLSGIYLDCVVDDVAIDGKILIASQVIVWKNSDSSGGVARINVGYEMTNDWPYVDSRIVGTKHLSVTELASLVNDPASKDGQADFPEKTAPDTKPSTWAPSNDTVNTVYKAAGVAGIGLLAHWIQNQMDQ